jgi:hypothetical protein
MAEGISPKLILRSYCWLRSLQQHLHLCPPEPTCATSRFSVKMRHKLPSFSIPLTSDLPSSACPNMSICTLTPQMHEQYTFPACHSTCLSQPQLFISFPDFWPHTTCPFLQRLTHPRTLPSCVHRVIPTRHPQTSTWPVSVLLRTPCKTHQLAFSSPNFTTKNHGRTAAVYAIATKHHGALPLYTSSPQRLTTPYGVYKYIYTNKLYFELCTPLFWPLGGFAHHRYTPHILLHIPTFFQNFSTLFLTSFIGGTKRLNYTVQRLMRVRAVTFTTYDDTIFNHKDG